MNAKQYRAPRHVDALVDFERIRAQAAEYGYRRAQLPSDTKFRFGPNMALGVVAGFAVCALITIVSLSSPAQPTDTHTFNEKYALSETIKHNTEALRRSRAWWEGYGRRHMQARHSAVNETD